MVEALPKITFIGTIEVHPAANLFPEMGQSDLDALYDSVKEHGLRVPVVFFEGKLLDGRNRVRACVMAGISTDRIPKVNLPEHIDPYKFAWDANCTRLDYSPGRKAEIHARVVAASGELERLRREAEAAANRSRAAKAAQEIRSQPRAATGKLDGPPGGPPRGGQPGAPREGVDRRRNNTAAKLAAQAGVSQRTMERHLAVVRPPNTPKPYRYSRPGAKNWTVPRDLKAMAAFLRSRLTSKERERLVALLTRGDEDPS